MSDVLGSQLTFQTGLSSHHPGPHSSGGQCNVSVMVTQTGTMSLHHGKLIGVRQTFNLETKVSIFVEVLGPYVQVDRDLDTWKHVSQLFITNKGLYSYQKY